MSETPERAPFPFIVACGRSGTTLLRAVLDSHPEMAIPPETKFIMEFLEHRRRYERPDGFDTDRFVDEVHRSWVLRQLDLTIDDVRSALARPPADMPDAIRRLFARYAELRGKSRYGNKTPVHVLSISALADAFPEARFVHIIRDGRDVALSYVGADIGPDTIAAAALRWRRWVRRGREAGATIVPDRYLEVRYETLVEEAEEVAGRVAAFLDLAYDPAMLRYHERADEVVAGVKRPHNFQGLWLPPTRGMRDWRHEMSPSDRAVFEALAGDLLLELGYEVSERPLRLGDRLRARAGALAADGRRASDKLANATWRRVRRRMKRSRAVAASRR